MLKVCAKQCDQCLLSPRRIVGTKRAQNILRECRRKDTHFLCHKGSIAGRDVVCRGFYDTQTSQMIRIAERLGAVEFVDPITGEKP